MASRTARKLCTQRQTTKMYDDVGKRSELHSNDRGKLIQQREAEVSCNSHSLLADLKCCSMKRDLQWGKRIHSKAVESKNDSDLYVSSALIKMYAKCGSMVDANRVFDSIHNPNVVCWTSLLLGYAQNGEGLTALELFSRMKTRGVLPNSVTYVAALKGCTALAVNGNEKEDGLKRGRAIHAEIGCHMNHFVQNNGEELTALELFSKMKAHGCSPNSVTYVAALRACTSLAVNGDNSEKGECLKRGKEIHSEIGCHLDHCLQNMLIDMYAKCGSMVDACSVFDSIQKPDVVSWTALLLGHAENGEGRVALELFSSMKMRRCLPNSVTYVAALKACTSVAVNGDGERKCLKRGREIHSEIGCHMNRYVQSTLIEMYCKCGSMVEARQVFDNIQNPNVVSWTALILGYADNGDGSAALEIFSRMKARGCALDSVAYVAALKACTSLATNGDGIEKGDGLGRGKEIHSEIGCHLNNYVQSTLLEMYAKCRSMVDARRVFNNIENPNVVAWTSLIMGYAENGEGHTALELFGKMKETGCAPNSATYVAVLKACTSLGGNGDRSEKLDCLELGRAIHSEVGPQLDRHLQNMLVNMYAKCGSMADARLVFDSIEAQDVVSWTALILGYAENGEGHAALDLFSKMKVARGSPDSVTYIAALKACGLIGALALGRKFHSDITVFTARVVTCLIDFYAKCGSMVEAREVFDKHSSSRDLSAWNALLAGYGSFGDTASVFNLFEAMQDQGFPPDGVTFLCMLSCCNHAGLVEKAMKYFEAMPVQYAIVPTVMHYTCMVDVLGRANQLKEATTMLQKMPYNANTVTWMTLLGACRKWKNAEIGEWAFQSLLRIDRKNAPAYVLMAHIYGSRGMLQEHEKVLTHAIHHNS